MADGRSVVGGVEVVICDVKGLVSGVAVLRPGGVSAWPRLKGI